MCPLLGSRPTKQACALTDHWTGDPLVRRPALNPLSRMRQGWTLPWATGMQTWTLSLPSLAPAWEKKSINEKNFILIKSNSQEKQCDWPGTATHDNRQKEERTHHTICNRSWVPPGWLLTRTFPRFCREPKGGPKAHWQVWADPPNTWTLQRGSSRIGRQVNCSWNPVIT